MNALLAPVAALAVWTHLVLLWMYSTRLPAVRRMGLISDRTAPRGAQMATLPPKTRWKSDNYTHLLEHPTVFYAVCLTLAAQSVNARWIVVVAWTYVALRVVHTLVQTTVNHIPTRFLLFAASGVCGLALSIGALISVLG
ncbi:MAG: MAPEG family protein [Nannocystaceae bacterium]|nr:MAPEG family protein [Nannocystaceae bacterium]